MGANGRATAVRRELDFYPTPAWMVDHLLDRLEWWPEAYRAQQRATYSGSPPARPPRILEPCVGAGNIVNAIHRRYPETLFMTNDIDPDRDAHFHLDATEPAGNAYEDIKDNPLWTHRGRVPDWVVTNPPFSEAFDIVRHAVETATVGVAMLLRTTWLEPTKTGPKAAWLVAHPPKWELVMERYSFDGSGSQDSAPTAWFVWSPYLESRIEVIPGRGRQEGLPL